MIIKKIKMKKIRSNTLLSTGDQVFLKPYQLECTLLNDMTDGFVIHIDTNNQITYITRNALENHFLKII